ncbi:hypothetical protein [Glaciibacter flavus]|uniref:hypothetical protein n=1 Tax=Orlajensenia flava TaxID=2565934 RepID=UPI003B00D2A3
MRSSLGIRWRRLVTFGIALPARRAARDVGVLACWTVLLALTVAVAIGAPRLALGVVDATAADAVAQAGASADLLVEARVAATGGAFDVPVIPPEDIVAVAKSVADNLPPTLAAVHRDSTLSVLTGAIPTEPVAGSPATSLRVQVRAGLLTASASRALTVVDGRLPADSAGVIEGVVSRSTADAAGIVVGTRLGLSFAGAVGAQVEIVGIAEAPASSVAASRQIPSSFRAPTSGAGSSVGTTVLVTPTGLTAAVQAGGEPATATMRERVRRPAFTAERVDEVARESRQLELDPSSLLPNSPYTIQARSTFDDVQLAFAARERTVRAQFVVLTVGVLAIALLVLLIIGGVLVRRRAADVALERARGSSLSAVAFRAAGEAVVVGVIGCGMGLGLVAAAASASRAAAAPGLIVDPSWLVAALLIAVLALPLQTVWQAWRAEAGRRTPADRRDRDALRRRARTVHVIVDVAVVLLAVVAVISLQSRGLGGGAGGVDLVAAAAPVLVAAAVTVLVARVYRWPVRAIAAVARRSRGAWGLLGAVRAERSLAVLPLLALTLAVALVAADAVLAATVRAGQEDASWARVGADARLEARGADPIDADVAGRVRDADGVTGASAQFVGDSVDIDLGTASTLATVVAVDRHYPDLVAALPALPGVVSPTDAGAFRSLKPSGDGPLPVVVDRTVAERLVSDDLTITFGDIDVPARVVATVDDGPSGSESGPFLFADLDALAAAAPDVVAADTVVAVGPGSARALRLADAGAVTTRAAWLARWRAQADVAGVQAAIGLGTGMLALFALVGFAGWMAGGSRERTRSAALLRTVGMPSAVRLFLALADELALVIAATIGGVVAAIALVWATTSGLGLGALTGGVVTPAPVVPSATVPVVIAGMVGAVAIGLLVDAVATRRHRSIDVLRAGETI